GSTSGRGIAPRVRSSDRHGEPDHERASAVLDRALRSASAVRRASGARLDRRQLLVGRDCFRPNLAADSLCQDAPLASRLWPGSRFGGAVICGTGFGCGALGRRVRAGLEPTNGSWPRNKRGLVIVSRAPAALEAGARPPGKSCRTYARSMNSWPRKAPSWTTFWPKSARSSSA